MFDQFELLTVAETAVMLRCSANVVYPLIHKGTLKHTKRGKSYLIAKSSIQNYIAHITSHRN